MADGSQRSKGRGSALSSLNLAIDGLNAAKDATSSIPLAGVVFVTVTLLLTTIRVSPLLPDVRSPRLTHSQDSMANDMDFVELGLSCANICRALERGMGGKKMDDLNQPVCDAMNQLTT